MHVFWVTTACACLPSVPLPLLLQRLKSVDFYRKLPTDLTEATLSGAAISIATTFIILFLLGAVRWGARPREAHMQWAAQGRIKLVLPPPAARHLRIMSVCLNAVAPSVLVHLSVHVALRVA